MAPGNPGSLLAIQIGRKAAARLESVAEARAVPGKGLEGDRYFLGRGHFSWKVWRTGHQLTLIESETIAALEREHGITLSPVETRRNLVTSGVSLNDLVGKTFRVGAVRMKGVRLAEPCDHLERLTQPGVTKSLVHRGGLRADILDDGVLHVGDAIVLAPDL